MFLCFVLEALRVIRLLIPILFSHIILQFASLLWLFCSCSTMASPPSIGSQYDPKTDPARKPKRSTDPGWKYAYWPELSNKDKIACLLCGGGGSWRDKKV